MTNYERMIKIKRTIDKAEKERVEVKKQATSELKEITKILKRAKKLTQPELQEIIERKEYFENLLKEEEIIYYDGTPIRMHDPDVAYIFDNLGKVCFINEVDKELRKVLIKSKRITKIDKWLKKNINFSIKKYLKDSLCED